MKSDPIDAKIIKALLDDGRASYREIARRTSLTTPTVSARMARMLKAGVIKKFVPVLSANAANRGVLVFIHLLIPGRSAERVAENLAKLQEVEGVYMGNGETNIVIKVALEKIYDVQPFIRTHILSQKGVDVSSSFVITSVVKEESANIPPTELSIDLLCDYCGQKIRTNRPYNMTMGSLHYYFCCKTCKRAYIDEHRSRLLKIQKSAIS